MHWKANLCFPEPDWRRSHSDQAGFSLVGVWGDSAQGLFNVALASHLFVFSKGAFRRLRNERSE